MRCGRRRLSSRGRQRGLARWAVVTGVTSLLACLLGPGVQQASAATDSYRIAFQSTSNILYYTTPANAGQRDTGLVMAAGTSPAIASSGEVAFQGKNNDLWLYDPATGGYRDAGLGMSFTTSPAIDPWPAAATR